MMRRYLAASAGVHFAFLGLLVAFSLFRPSHEVMFIDGFEYMGSGGGGNGKSAGAGVRPENAGQVVPQPIQAPVPEKPAPVQKAVAAEETWKIKTKADAKPEPIKKAVETPVERGEKAQEEKVNIIRRGVGSDTKVAEGNFDFGPGEGGTGKGVGIGFGPGEGGGFGGFSSYLKLMRQRIWSEWTQSAVFGSNQVCVVGLTVSRSGEISDIRVEKPSGNSFYDSVAMRAVRNSSPLQPLPSEFPRSEQRFRIQFRLLD